ncbi:MAG: SBBP repeat-containing protein [Bryobacteraceae bacterium]
MIFTKTFEGFLPAGLALDRLGNAIIAGHGLVMKVTTDGQVAARLPIGALVEGVAVDDAGAIYLTGTADENFRATPGAAKPASDRRDATRDRRKTPCFARTRSTSKLRPDLSAFVYATFLGGIRTERAAAIAVDGSGAAYVTGETWSADFPVARRFCNTPTAAESIMARFSYGDVFVTKVDPSGRSFTRPSSAGEARSGWVASPWTMLVAWW